MKYNSALTFHIKKRQAKQICQKQISKLHLFSCNYKWESKDSISKMSKRVIAYTY